MKRLTHSQSVRLDVPFFATLVWLTTLGLAVIPASVSADSNASSRSTNIALSGNLLFNVNVEANSVTVFSVGSGGLKKLNEVPVGREPFCVAVKGNRAFVTNAASGTVSVIASAGGNFKVIKEIVVGTEPRGCALAPNGTLYVANHTEGTVSVINTSSGQEIKPRIEVGGNPFAIAIDKNRVFVTDFFARLIPDPDGPGPLGGQEGFDDGKQGIVHSFPVNDPDDITQITLSPLTDSGFRADRSNFCNNTRVVAGVPTPPVNQTFCPDVNAGPGDPVITQDLQAVHPNQLNAALICDGKLYLPNIGAQPEPPVFFNVNVQALVHVVDTTALSELTASTVNLNAQIATEPNPVDRFGASLQRLFGNDIVAIDADKKCENFFIVSRGGNYVIKARLVGGKLDIGAPDNVVRIQTGNIPSGIVVHGKTAFVNNEVDMSVSVLDLDTGLPVGDPVASSTPPEPGSFDHSRLVGKLVFFTALGVPDNNENDDPDGRPLRGIPIREIIPLEFRGKQSSDAWSTCASCHPAGLADGVTWIFGDGPRQAIPLDALYSKVNGAHDTRINNWSAARDSITDFNNNSRNVQCGKGFAGGDPTLNAAGNGACPNAGAIRANPAIYDHGISQGASQALDVETTWGQTVRPFNMPQGDPAVVGAGAAVFKDNCGSCHGGAKWTKSQVFYLNNPALTRAFAAGDLPRDPLLTNTGNEFVEYAGGGAPPAGVDTGTLKFLDIISTFDPLNPIEIRGQGNPGGPPFGVLGFNVPSLLSVNYHAPYFHNGQATTLEDVFAQHLLNGATIADTLGDADEANLLAFLRSIDGRTATFESDGDIFKDPTKNLP